MRGFELLLALLLPFLLGVMTGVMTAREECAASKCAVPCGLTKHVEVIHTGADWTEWSCRCKQP